MGSLDVAIVAVFVILFGLVSGKIPHLGLTGTIIFVLFGLVVGPKFLDWIDLEVENHFAHTLAELTLVLVLFTDASRIDLRVLWRNRGTPIRLLGIGLPLTIAAGFGVGVFLFGDRNLWEIAMLAAILAPTDAALGQPVVSNPRVPVRIRQALNVESGLNDGVCVPVLAMFAAGAEFSSGAREGLEAAGFWFGFAAEAIGYGILIGLGVGLLAAKLVDSSIHANWVNHTFRRLSVIAIPIASYALAESSGGSGFIAAFVAGLAVGSLTRHCGEALTDFADEEGELLGLLTWIIFGGAFVGKAFDGLTWRVIAYASLSLTLVRMLPVALSLLRSGFHTKTVIFMGWFGPRGLASIVFAIGVLDNQAIDGKEDILLVVTWTVLLSVVAHGISALPGAKWYGQHCDGRDEDVAEKTVVEELRLRKRRSILTG